MQVCHHLRNFRSIILPKGLKTIGESIFYGCNSLNCICIPKDCISKYEVLLPGYEDKLVEYDGDGNLSEEVTAEDLANAWTDEYGVKYSKDKKRLLKVPKELRDYSIIEGTIVICNNVFTNLFDRLNYYVKGLKKGDKGIVTITMPKSVKLIGKDAFAYCPYLTSIYIPIGTKEKYEKMLSNYKDKLFERDENEILSTEVTDEDLVNAWTDEYGVKYSADRKRLLKALSHRFSTHVVSPITDYSILEGTEIICNGAFYHYQKIKGHYNWAFPAIDSTLKTVSIPSTVIELGDKVFEDCKELTSIKIPQNVKVIGTRAFAGCEKLTSIYISNAEINFRGSFVYEYGRKCNTIDSLFWGCTNLKAIFIPKGTLTKIENQLPSYKNQLIEICYEGHNWHLNDIRLFYKEEIEAVKTATVGASQYGASVCFTMKSGELKYIPLSNHSSLTIGDTLDLKTAKLITLSREGDDDIYRVLE